MSHTREIAKFITETSTDALFVKTRHPISELRACRIPQLAFTFPNKMPSRLPTTVIMVSHPPSRLAAGPRKLQAVPAPLYCRASPSANIPNMGAPSCWPEVHRRLPGSQGLLPLDSSRDPVDPTLISGTTSDITTRLSPTPRAGGPKTSCVT
ncbi:hypothetical protein K466DRAFT_215384 [Polyporus arcularius HHB13444]|uniref:Uncharacterized protein n=1 Tax=Polyporus arcularius HHB13444 TaxID=1314778 RepID=A0A5C3P4X2_9APHY|nr:hypothetical protein K466DRAFT_215384 [Polyporus arcularius HHB13444]